MDYVNSHTKYNSNKKTNKRKHIRTLHYATNVLKAMI